MLRVLHPEILDHLPHDDPDALASRRDLGRINRVMGNWRWTAAMLHRHVRDGDRVLEIGAGRGEFFSWLERAAPQLADRVSFTGLDLAPRPGTFPLRRQWVQLDLLDFAEYGEFDVVVANLVLHHFDEPRLRELGARLANGPRVVIACEPARARFHLWQARALTLLGVNRVTRHDAPASVVAGFRARELPAFLGLETDAWVSRVASTWRGAYRMAAVRAEKK